MQFYLQYICVYWIKYTVLIKKEILSINKYIIYWVFQEQL
jgi:hypothetical protein